MSSVQVYALRIVRDLTREEWASLLEILPYRRRQRLLRTREDKQLQVLCAYGALHLALQRQYDFYGFPPIAIASEGKPYFPDYPSIQFNLSHTDGAVVCALSETPVGVDLERSRPPAGNILHYYHVTESSDFWEMWGPPGGNCQIPRSRFRRSSSLGRKAGRRGHLPLSFRPGGVLRCACYRRSLSLAVTLCHIGGNHPSGSSVTR